MLTSKERAVLRSKATDLDAVFQVGKDGIGEELIKSVDDCLKARELIKLRVLENSGLTAISAAREIAEKTGSEVVAAIGSKFILYRKAPEKKEKKKEVKPLHKKIAAMKAEEKKKAQEREKKKFHRNYKSKDGGKKSWKK